MLLEASSSVLSRAQPRHSLLLILNFKVGSHSNAASPPQGFFSLLSIPFLALLPSQNSTHKYRKKTASMRVTFFVHCCTWERKRQGCGLFAWHCLKHKCMWWLWELKEEKSCQQKLITMQMAGVPFPFDWGRRSHLLNILSTHKTTQKLRWKRKALKVLLEKNNNKIK